LNAVPFLANGRKPSYGWLEDRGFPANERRSGMLAPSPAPGSREHGRKLMEFFCSRQDQALLLVMDSASRSGHVFKIVADETWTLIWSGIVTQDFLESPAWKWQETVKDPDTFAGGWPKQNDN
jgi:hypothetical protein